MLVLFGGAVGVRVDNPSNNGDSSRCQQQDFLMRDDSFAHCFVVVVVVVVVIDRLLKIVGHPQQEVVLAGSKRNSKENWTAEY